jgi:hypothetical protein
MLNSLHVQILDLNLVIIIKNVIDATVPMHLINASSSQQLVISAVSKVTLPRPALQSLRLLLDLASQDSTATKGSTMLTVTKTA